MCIQQTKTPNTPHLRSVISRMSRFSLAIGPLQFHGPQGLSINHSALTSVAEYIREREIELM